MNSFKTSVFALTVLALIVAPVANAAKRFEEYNFKRTFKAKDTAMYAMEMTLPDSSGKVTADIATTVDTVTPEGATVKYVSSNVVMFGNANAAANHELTTTVGPLGMPNKVKITNEEEFFVFLGIAGIVPNTKAKTGDDVSVQWQNEAKDVSVDGKGKILEASKDGKTISVDWTLSVKPKDLDPGNFKIKSVYLVDDFSLVSSEGTISIGESSLGFKVAKKEKS